ncbi:MAG: 5-(carboxyamino)imidazole ribonucleotide mutase [Myxococcales bacterium]|nr:5-(carboxyamino)imidazole ribonucleotide mutase [Myxococcales bacterium]
MEKKKVLILMGSENDRAAMEECRKVLADLGVECELRVASAHRTPGKVAELAVAAEGRGFGVIVAGAGLAAHLAGAVAAHSLLPVIGVPLEAGPLQGLDALLSTVQMPRGVPVATMAIGTHGAANAGLFAAAILALSDPALRGRLETLRRDMAERLERQDAAVRG